MLSKSILINFIVLNGQIKPKGFQWLGTAKEIEGVLPQAVRGSMTNKGVIQINV